MPRNLCLTSLLACCLVSLLNAFANAADDGKELLDQAVEKKLVAEKYEELQGVIELAEKALQAGLTGSDAELAKNLLAGTYSQRGIVLCELTVREIGRNPNTPNWLQARAAGLKDLEKSLEYDDTAAEVHLAVARLHTLPGGKADRAKTALDACIKYATDDAATAAKAYLLRAELSDDVATQNADLDQAAKLAPKEKDIFRTRGIFYLLRKSDAKQALSEFDRALELDPQDSSLQHLRGLCLLERKDYNAAITAFTASLDLDGKNPQTRIQRARTYFLLKQHDLAQEDLNVAIAREPNNPALLLLRARVRQVLGETDAAKQDIETALQLNPTSQAGIEFRALLAANSGDYKRAIEDCRELLKLVPDHPQLLLQLGLLHTGNKQPRAAIEALTTVLTKQPDNFLALRTRGDSYLSVGKHEAAIADLEAALKLKPKDPGVLNNLAWVLCTSPDEKLRNAKRATELATLACEETQYKMPHIISTLAAAYADAGDFKKAGELVEQALKLDGDQEQLEHIKKEQASYQAGKPWREMQNDTEAE